MMAVQAKNLRLAFIERKLDFHLPAERFVAILGPNGCGKTTLLRTLIGEQQQTEGTLTLFDQAVHSLSPADLSTIVSYVAQEHDFPDNLKVVDLLRYAFLPQCGWFKALPEAEDPRIQNALGLFRLLYLRDRPLRRLSTGERQRAFLARACLQEPRALILDEPTNHLDPGGVKSFWNILRNAQDSRKFSVLMSTHELAMVREHCDWILALNSNGVLYNGTAKVFFDQGLELELYPG